MTFQNLYEFVQKQLETHQEICLENDFLAVNIKDLFDNAFYILWNDRKITVAPYFYQDYQVCITASQRTLELLFSERQYLFSAYLNKELKVQGTFEDVMKFQKILSYITKDNSMAVQETLISDLIAKQDMLIEAVHLMLVNSLTDLPKKTILSSGKKISSNS